MDGIERFDTVVIGGSQAGLAMGYYLAQQGRSFVILEGGERAGDGWRNRWDSLRLFTPAKYNGLPGLRFPGKRWSFPTKDEMADYLESYAAHHDLPLRTRARVDAVSRNDSGYTVTTTGGEKFEAANVVVATGAHQHPKVPAFATELDPRIVQIHSLDYRNPAQLADGPVLVVGLGNSGAEIALESIKDRQTFLSGQPSAQLPVKHGSPPARIVMPIIRFLGRHVLTWRTPIGRKAGPKLVSKAAPLIRTKTTHLEAAGVERVARVTGVEDGKPVLEDGRVLDVANVIWCTGFRYDFSWVDLPSVAPDGGPVHTRGIVHDAPGLYFLGLVFQFAVASDVVAGVARDAAWIARDIALRARATTPARTAV